MTDSKYVGRKYTVEKYDPSWKTQFEREAEFFRIVFKEKALSIDHVGSTSVPGLFGKPTIDLLITVENISIADELKIEIENLGYKALGDYLNLGSRLIVREKDDNTRLVNIHIFEIAHPHQKSMLALRDYFRSHPDIVNEYNMLKDDLVKKYPEDYGMYRKYKDEWMNELKKNIGISL